MKNIGWIALAAVTVIAIASKKDKPVVVVEVPRGTLPRGTLPGVPVPGGTAHTGGKNLETVTELSLNTGFVKK